MAKGVKRRLYLLMKPVPNVPAIIDSRPRRIVKTFSPKMARLVVLIR